jgi:hypothetical protein
MFSVAALLFLIEKMGKNDKNWNQKNNLIHQIFMHERLFLGIFIDTSL